MADAEDLPWLRGEEIADPGLIVKIKTKGHDIEWVDHRHFDWNDWQEFKTNSDKNPDADPPKICLREDAKKIEVLEEFLHDTQERIAKRTGKTWIYPRYEVHVKDFMIRHRRMLRITDADAEVLRQMLVRVIELSKVDTEGCPLALPPSARTRIGI